MTATLGSHTDTGLIDRLGAALTKAVDLAVEHRWEQAQSRAAATAHLDRTERVSKIIKSFQIELSSFGAAVGGAAAAPFGGTTLAVATAGIDIAWVTGRLADMILTIAVVHGHDRASVEDRRMFVLSVLAGGDTAAQLGKEFAAEAGKGLGKKATKAIPKSAIKSVNGAFSRTIVTKYGTKQGVVALGEALPFGIGAVIGGSANYMITRSIGRGADAYLRSIAAPEMAG